MKVSSLDFDNGGLMRVASEADYEKVNGHSSSRPTIRWLVDDLRFATLFLRSPEDVILGRGYVASCLASVMLCGCGYGLQFLPSMVAMSLFLWTYRCSIGYHS